MDLTAARTLAENLIAKHLPSGWTFAFDAATTRLGQCSHARRRITVSQQFAAAEEQQAVEQVLFHEIGHAIAGSKAKHGPAWLSAARRLGYTGKATVRHEDTTEGADLVKRTLEAAELVKDRTDGPLVMGEKVHFLGGKQGLFVEAKRTRAIVWSPSRRRLMAVPLAALARTGQTSQTQQTGYTKTATQPSTRTPNTAASRYQAAIDHALSRVEAMKTRNSGPFMAGETLTVSTGQEFIFIEPKRVNALAWSVAEKKVYRVPMASLARKGQQSSYAQQREDRLARAIAAAPTAARRTTGAIIVGEHVAPTPGYQPFTGLLIDVEDEKRRGTGQTAVISRDITGDIIRIRYTDIVRAPGAYIPATSAIATDPVAAGDNVVIVKPRSKYNGLTGTVERSAGHSWRIRLSDGSILTAAKSLVRKVA